MGNPREHEPRSSVHVSASTDLRSRAGPLGSIHSTIDRCGDRVRAKLLRPALSPGQASAVGSNCRRAHSTDTSPFTERPGQGVGGRPDVRRLGTDRLRSRLHPNAAASPDIRREELLKGTAAADQRWRRKSAWSGPARTRQGRCNPAPGDASGIGAKLSVESPVGAGSSGTVPEESTRRTYTPRNKTG